MKHLLPYILGAFIVVSTFSIGFVINSSRPLSAELSSRRPSDTNKKGPASVREAIQLVRSHFSDASLLSSGNCVKNLDSIYDQMYSLKLADFSLSSLENEAPALLQELFNLRLFIRTHFQETFNGAGEDANAKLCATAHRRLFRAMRVFEDYLGMVKEHRIQVPGLTPRADKDEIPVFKGSAINLLWNEKYQPENPLDYIPQSGDVLLSRGSASVSAAIARITDEDSNFSHAGIVYIDPVTHKRETIEAHIEFGTLVADIKNYSDTKVRALVFRFRDPLLVDDEKSTAKEKNAAIAHEAAKKVRQIVLEYKKNYGSTRMPNPCYDFSMDIDNPKEITPFNGKCLFCSEVVSLAFSLVAGGKYKIPTFKSAINPVNKKFLKDIGVTVTKTFAPADIEVDPYFDLVMEWRDYNRIHKTHVMDSILTAVYTWMDSSERYQFYLPTSAAIKTDLAVGIRHIPILDQLTGVKNKFPLNMSKAAVNTMVMLDEVSNQLANVIYDQEKKTGSTLTPNEMLNLLTEWRIKDAADFKAGIDYNSEKDLLKSHRFHHLLRAKDNEK